MTTVYVSDGDDVFPVLSMSETKTSWECHPVEMSEIDLERMRKAFAEYKWAQDVLGAFAGERARVITATTAPRSPSC